MDTDSRTSRMTVREAGRLGGLKTLQRFGRQHFVSAGRYGQQIMARRYTTEDRCRWGAMGGRPKRVRFTNMGEKKQCR